MNTSHPGPGFTSCGCTTPLCLQGVGQLICQQPQSQVGWLGKECSYGTCSCIGHAADQAGEMAPTTSLFARRSPCPCPACSDPAPSVPLAKQATAQALATAFTNGNAAVSQAAAQAVRRAGFWGVCKTAGGGPPRPGMLCSTPASVVCLLLHIQLSCHMHQLHGFPKC